MKKQLIKSLLKSREENEEVELLGWVRSHRGSKNISFIALNDGSTINNIQVVAESKIFDQDILKRITVGSAISVSGKLVKSEGGGQNIEVLAS